MVFLVPAPCEKCDRDVKSDAADDLLCRWYVAYHCNQAWNDDNIGMVSDAYIHDKTKVVVRNNGEFKPRVALIGLAGPYKTLTLPSGALAAEPESESRSFIFIPNGLARQIFELVKRV